VTDKKHWIGRKCWQPSLKIWRMTRRTFYLEEGAVEYPDPGLALDCGESFHTSPPTYINRIHDLTCQADTGS
jgi:hypothetical protein